MELLRHRPPPQELDQWMKTLSESGKTSQYDSFPDKVIIRYCDEARKGKGLFASQIIEAGEIILVDNPILVLQESGSEACCVCCRSVEVSSSSESLAQAAAASCDSGSLFFCSDHCIEYAREKQHLYLLYPDHRALCGKGCTKATWDLQRAFREHAFRTNKIFILAGRGLASIVGSWREERLQRENEGKVPHLSIACQWDRDRLQQLALPLSSFTS